MARPALLALSAAFGRARGQEEVGANPFSPAKLFMHMVPSSMHAWLSHNHTEIDTRQCLACIMTSVLERIGQTFVPYEEVASKQVDEVAVRM